MNIEKYLPPSDEFQEVYHQCVSFGKKHLFNKTIVILGLVRNLEKVLEKNLEKLIHFASTAKDYKIVLFENDSSDNTKDILKLAADQNNHIEYYSEVFNRKHFGPTKETERTEALAEYRNFLLNIVKTKYINYDYVIVSDMDFVDFSESGCYHSFGLLSQIDSIDGVAGNSFELKEIFSGTGTLGLWNYDSWAFRPTWWNLHQHKSPLITYDAMLWFGLCILPIGSPLVSVNSAFGGMAIYKTDKIINGQYSGYDCEHVCFHYDLKQKGDFKLYLNPSQTMLV
jgi:hypothetical protein